MHFPVLALPHVNANSDKGSISCVRVRRIGKGSVKGRIGKGTEAINLYAPAAAQRLRPSARRERAALPGPLWRGGRVEESPQDGRQEAGQFFAGTGTCRRKTPQPARAPGRQDAWRARHRGVVFSWLLLFDSGHPALRPSGRLRRSYALLRVRGQAKEK